MAKFILQSVIAIAVGMQAFSSLDAQKTSGSAEAQCRRTLESQNRLFCETKPVSDWNPRQACIDRNQNFFERCMRNANVTNRNKNGYRNPDNQPYSTGDNE